MVTKKEPDGLTDLKTLPKAQKSTKQTDFLQLNQKSGECCQGSPHCSTTAVASTVNAAPSFAKKETAMHSLHDDHKKGPKTRIVVKYDVGYNNSLFLRGKGASLSWDKGIQLKNVKNDEWVWETDASFKTCEFKVLINDQSYETGENHPLACGASIQYSPHF